MIRLLFGLALLWAGSPALAQTAPGEAPFGVWAAYLGTAALGDGPFSVRGEAHLRLHNVGTDLQQVLVGPAVLYALSDRSGTLGLGYGFLHSEAEGEPDAPTDEHRLYAEAFLRQSVLVVGVGHRFRYEQRWVDDLETQGRFRYALFGTVPLGGPVTAVGMSEVFLRGPGRGDRPVFDRTRLSAGLGVQVAPGLRVQGGYLSQVFADRSDGQVQLSLFHTFAL